MATGAGSNRRGSTHCLPCTWLLGRQSFADGDWKVYRPHAKGGGWAFEFVNDNYPDLDDTAVILSALNQLQLRDVPQQERALSTGFRWMTAMHFENSREAGGGLSQTHAAARWFVAGPLGR